MVGLWWHNGDGNGNGDANGDGDGYGAGDANGDGDGYGDGYDYGDGNGDGDGNGYGYGYGDGDGNGNGYGDGDGNGYGYGDGLLGVSESTPVMAYWYIGAGNIDHMGAPLRAVVGAVHEWPYQPEMCSSGLHASLTPGQAAQYRGGTLCRVACSGLVRMGADKLVCTRREIVEVVE